jgi:hypothetical protein
LAAISADEFRPRLICLSRCSPRSISFFESRVQREFPPIYKRPVFSPPFGHSLEKGRSDASGDGGGRVGPNPRIREVTAQVTLETVS